MKKFFGFIILIGALILGSYYGMGVLTERAIKKNIDVLNQGQGVQVTLHAYHRGLFHSHAMLKWNLHLSTPSADSSFKTLNVDMPLTIHHGPIIIAHGQLHFGLGSAESSVAIPTDTEKQPQLNLRVFVNYFNQTTIDIHVPPFAVEARQTHAKIDWKGLESQIQISAARKQIKGDVLMEGLAWVNDRVHAIIGRVKSQYHIHFSRSGLTLGDAEINLPYLSIAEHDVKALELRNLDLRSESHVTKGLFSSVLSLKADDLTLNNRQFHACKLDFHLRNLDAATLVHINHKLSNVNDVNQTSTQQVFLSVLADLPNLLNHGAEEKLAGLTLG